MKTGASHYLVIKARNEHHIGDEYAGVWGPEPPLGNARGLSPLKNFSNQAVKAVICFFVKPKN